ncbi:MAG: DUF998 domain-containing protein, partial [Sulfolobus sp.]|nr:DUF998 domain-containing protein [Sulfolobus sp.]
MYGLIIKILAHSGFAGIITSLTSILISIYLNPWFDFLKNAFSDLGSDYANYPFVFNYGLVISSIFMFLYAVWLIYSAKNKIETIGSGF